MATIDDERRVLRFVAEHGGPSATTNVVGRGAEIGVDGDALPDLVEVLRRRELVRVLDDGDLTLTQLGRALVEADEGGD